MNYSGHFPAYKIHPNSRLSNRLHTQRFQYPFLRNLIGNIATLFQSNGADNRIHRMSHDEVYSGSSEVLGLCSSNILAVGSHREKAAESFVTNHPRSPSQNRQ